MRNYSAKILFQWNPSREGVHYRTRRVCEERIYTFTAESPLKALSLAKTIGKSEELNHDSDGVQVEFLFVGVLDLVEVNDGGEVWYQIKEHVAKNGALNHLIPDETQLRAFATDIKKKLSAW